MAFADDLELLIRARYPIISIPTSEETRVTEIALRLANTWNKKMFEWTCSTGLIPAGISIQSQQSRNPATRDPLLALEQVLDQVEPAIYVFKDLHPFLTRNHAHIIRRLKDIAIHLKHSRKTVLLVSPSFELPMELEKEITLLPCPLPGHIELEGLLNQIIEEVGRLDRVSIDLDRIGRERLIQAALGLTLTEAENVFAKILVKDGRLSGEDIHAVFAEKQQIVRKSGLLDYYEAQEGFDDIGGLDVLKRWLIQRANAFLPEARAFGLPVPRGVLLLGVQGCGKSLSAKAVASCWQLPLLRFDMGRMFGSLVGSSEENIRRAIQVAESVSPAVLWVDEIDKAFAGAQSSGSFDGGTTARVIGTFLTWLSEKTAPVFVVATANNVAQLPPELVRKGRLDEIFFVDLPSLTERMEILAVHLVRRNRDPADFDLKTIALAAVDFSGAELEEAIHSGLYVAYADGVELNSDHVLNAVQETVPLAHTLSEQIQHLRQWAAGRARRASVASNPE